VVESKRLEKCEKVLVSRGIEHWLQQSRVSVVVNKVFNSVYLTTSSFCSNNTFAYTNTIEACLVGIKRQNMEQKGRRCLLQGGGCVPHVALAPSRRGAAQASPTVWLLSLLRVTHYTILPNSGVRGSQTF
jgi:hypothetical protein